MSGAPTGECARHGFPFGHASEPDSAYVKRCMHIGNRFVVDIRNDAWGSVHCDYVEDLSDDELICEAGGDGDWDHFVERMLAGDGPVWPS